MPPDIIISVKQLLLTLVYTHVNHAPVSITRMPVQNRSNHVTAFRQSDEKTDSGQCCVYLDPNAKLSPLQ